MLNVRLKAKFDLPDFIDGLKQHPLAQVIAEIEKEIQQVEGSLARDSRMKYTQVFYARSLSRILGLLKENTVPLDLTPKESTAFQELVHAIGQNEEVPPSLIAAFRQLQTPLAHAS